MQEAQAAEPGWKVRWTDEVIRALLQKIQHRPRLVQGYLMARERRERGDTIQRRREELAEVTIELAQMLSAEGSAKWLRDLEMDGLIKQDQDGRYSPTDQWFRLAASQYTVGVKLSLLKKRQAQLSELDSRMVTEWESWEEVEAVNPKLADCLRLRHSFYFDIKALLQASGDKSDDADLVSPLSTSRPFSSKKRSKDSRVDPMIKSVAAAKASAQCDLEAGRGPPRTSTPSEPSRTHDQARNAAAGPSCAASDGGVALTDFDVALPLPSSASSRLSQSGKRCQGDDDMPASRSSDDISTKPKRRRRAKQCADKRGTEVALDSGVAGKQVTRPAPSDMVKSPQVVQYPIPGARCHDENSPTRDTSILMDFLQGNTRCVAWTVADLRLLACLSSRPSILQAIIVYDPTYPTWQAERDLYIDYQRRMPSSRWWATAERLGWVEQVDGEWVATDELVWHAETLNPIRQKVDRLRRVYREYPLEDRRETTDQAAQNYVDILSRLCEPSSPLREQQRDLAIALNPLDTTPDAPVEVLASGPVHTAVQGGAGTARLSGGTGESAWTSEEPYSSRSLDPAGLSEDSLIVQVKNLPTTTEGSPAVPSTSPDLVEAAVFPAPLQATSASGRHCVPETQIMCDELEEGEIYSPPCDARTATEVAIEVANSSTCSRSESEFGVFADRPAEGDSALRRTMPLSPAAMCSTTRRGGVSDNVARLDRLRDKSVRKFLQNVHEIVCTTGLQHPAFRHLTEYDLSWSKDQLALILAIIAQAGGKDMRKASIEELLDEGIPKYRVVQQQRHSPPSPIVGIKQVTYRLERRRTAKHHEA